MMHRRGDGSVRRGGAAASRRGRRGGRLAVLAAVPLAALPAAAADPPAAWPAPVRILTASPGGTYFAYGTNLARFVEDRLGVDSYAVVTGGPYHNMALLHFGEAELGFVTMGPASESWNGKNPSAPGVRMRGVRALFPMYKTPFHVLVRADSPIRRFAALAGRRVGIGPRGGTPGTYFPRFFETFGLTATTIHDGFAPLGEALARNRIAAIGLAGGVPVPVPVPDKGGAERRIRIFAFDRAERDRLLGRFPFLSVFSIPAGTYPGQRDAVETVAMWNFAVAPASLPASLAYRLTRDFLESTGKRDIHPAAAESRPENAIHNGFLWFHPGALRYYRERGVRIPALLRPPGNGAGRTTR